MPDDVLGTGQPARNAAPALRWFGAACQKEGASLPNLWMTLKTDQIDPSLNWGNMCP